MKKLLIGFLLLFFALCVWLFGFGGCIPWTYRREPVKQETIAERKNLQGETIQKLTRERAFSSMDALITPDGPRKVWGIPYCKYFLEADGKPKRELPFLSFDKYNEPLDYRPVEQTSLWIGTDSSSIHDYDLFLVVFDEKRLLIKRTFKLNTNKFIQKRYQANELHFMDGNHTIIFSTLEGIKKYDVLNNTVTDADQMRDEWK
jgi:hypothetical protein